MVTAREDSFLVNNNQPPADYLQQQLDSLVNRSGSFAAVGFDKGDLSVKGQDGKKLFSFAADEQGNIPLYEMHGSAFDGPYLEHQQDVMPESLESLFKNGFMVTAIAGHDPANPGIIGFELEGADGTIYNVGPETISLTTEEGIINPDFTVAVKDGLEADAARDRGPQPGVNPSADQALEQAQQLEQQRMGANIGGPSVGLPS